jgi:alginate O-acetyltransferase complex protein AlgI
VMGLGGLWHGAGLGYLMWGLSHGALLVIERPFLARLQLIDSRIFRGARAGFVFVCVTMLWIFFKLPNFDHAMSYLSGMFTPGTNPNPPKLFYDLALLYSLPVMIQHLALFPSFERSLRGMEPYLYGAMAALAYLEAGPETSFIYFQF